MRHFIRLAIPLCLVCLFTAGCGNKGDLYLPQDSAEEHSNEER